MEPGTAASIWGPIVCQLLQLSLHSINVSPWQMAAIGLLVFTKWVTYSITFSLVLRYSGARPPLLKSNFSTNHSAIITNLELQAHRNFLVWLRWRRSSDWSCVQVSLCKFGSPAEFFVRTQKKKNCNLEIMDSSFDLVSLYFIWTHCMYVVSDEQKHLKRDHYFEETKLVHRHKRFFQDLRSLRWSHQQSWESFSSAWCVQLLNRKSLCVWTRNRYRSHQEIHGCESQARSECCPEFLDNSSPRAGQRHEAQRRGNSTTSQRWILWLQSSPWWLVCVDVIFWSDNSIKRRALLMGWSAMRRRD